MSPGYPRRILHVGLALNPAGMEALVLGAYRRIDRQRVQFDFAVPETAQGSLRDEVRSLGGRIFAYPIPSALRPLPFDRALRTILRDSGPFAGVHSHVYYFSGLVLRAAASSRVPLRIAHSHFTEDGFADSPARRIYHMLARRFIDRYATHKLGCSREACESLFGRDCWSDARTRVIPNGIDLNEFTNETGKGPAVREELGLPENAVLVGHVGRFAPQKNHRMVVDVFAALAARLPTAVLLLIGTGPAVPEIQRHVEELGLGPRVRFLGLRRDLPRLLRNLNVLVMPSLYEGFPVVLVEAQAAGLRCVVSKTITREVDLASGLVTFVDLASAPAEWADRITDALQEERRDRSALREQLRAAGYEIADVTRTLSSIYES